MDVMLPCPHDDECTGRAWAPAYSVTCLSRAPNGDLEDDEDLVCTKGVEPAPRSWVRQDEAGSPGRVSYSAPPPGSARLRVRRADFDHTVRLGWIRCPQSIEIRAWPCL
ncbi:hypothetical protein ACFYQT_34625 [Streptomyces tibetensis]|uniref:Uncharacterized protein n=1 Tax=Streptomyces tibetensis TaxID=2382123 RepID=A0ABW6N6Z4_9ACTN